MAKLIAFSYSRLNDYEICPRMFQGKYITKEFQVDTENEAMIRGRQVHELFEKLMLRGTQDMQGDYVEFKPLIDHLRKGNKVEVEYKLTFNFKMELDTWFSKQAWLRVVFDVLVIHGDTAYIIDWKTGKVRDKNRDQLKLFALAAFYAFPEINYVKSAYVWVDHPKAPPSSNVYYRSEVYSIESEFRDRSEMIQMSNQAGNWKPTPSNLCAWCPARSDQCEHKK